MGKTFCVVLVGLVAGGFGAAILGALGATPVHNLGWLVIALLCLWVQGAALFWLFQWWCVEVSRG